MPPCAQTGTSTSASSRWRSTKVDSSPIRPPLGARGDDRFGAGRRCAARFPRGDRARENATRSPPRQILARLDDHELDGIGEVLGVRLEPGMDAHAEAADLRVRQPRQGLASRSGVTSEVHRPSAPARHTARARRGSGRWNGVIPRMAGCSGVLHMSTRRCAKKGKTVGGSKATPAQGAVQVSPGDFPPARAAFAASVTRPSIRSTGTVA